MIEIGEKHTICNAVGSRTTSAIFHTFSHTECLHTPSFTAPVSVPDSTFHFSSSIIHDSISLVTEKQ